MQRHVDASVSGSRRLRSKLAQARQRPQPQVGHVGPVAALLPARPWGTRLHRQGEIGFLSVHLGCMGVCPLALSRPVCCPLADAGVALLASLPTPLHKFETVSAFVPATGCKVPPILTPKPADYDRTIRLCEGVPPGTAGWCRCPAPVVFVRCPVFSGPDRPHAHNKDADDLGLSASALLAGDWRKLYEDTRCLCRSGCCPAKRPPA